MLLRELVRFFEPLAAAAAGTGRDALLHDLGWVLAGTDPELHQEVNGALIELSETAAALANLSDPPPESFEDLAFALADVADVVATLGELPAALTRLPLGVLTELPQDLLNLLLVRWLGTYHPVAFRTLAVLTVLTPGEESPEVPPVLDANGAVIRAGTSPARLDLARLPLLLADPAGTLIDYYVGPGGLGDAVHTQQVADRLLPRLQMWLRALGADATLGAPVESNSGPLAQSLGKQLLVVTGAPTLPNVGAAISLAGADQGDLGVVIVPMGVLSRTLNLPSWMLEATVALSAGGVAVGPAGVILPPGQDARVSLALILTKKEGPSGSAVLLGAASGAHLKIGIFTITATVDLEGGRPPDIDVLVEFEHAAVAVAAGDGDGFLAKILPPGGFIVDFDLAIGWSARRGLYLRGAAQLDAQIPVHTTFLGVLTLETVDLSIGARTDPEPGAVAIGAATAAFHLGPVTASVERIGLELRVTFPNGGGNAGPANVALGFHPPIGALLAISATVVSGGGYLRADHVNGRYGGVLQLEIAKVVNATAIGSVVVTPNSAQPDAPRNYSLLVILVAEFPPIQLGFGFTLNGLGGILGANRTINVNALRAGVRTRALDSILFPKDAAANAIRILRDVEAVFPPAPGQFVIGLMARFGWGSPRLITIDIGIIIELPSPLRIVLLGRLSLALPEPDAAVVELHLDVVGILDLTNKNVSVDATLYDSRVAAFTISGDMAARLNYGAEPGLAVSAGGFNPRFTPPPDFPQLRRLAISLGEGDNPRIRLEAYLANTANSIQIGARLDVYVEEDFGALGVFSATAYLGFDALITLEPFSFVVDLAGGVEIRRNGAVLFGAELRLSLSGPQPVRAWGYAQFDFFGRHRIPFDHTFGPDPLELVLAVVDPVAALLTALADPRNWQSQLPDTGPPTASLRDLPPAPDGTIFAHPLGTIGVRQRVVPLDLPINRFAGTPLPSTRTLRVSVSLGGNAAAGRPVRDAFPTGESLELTDDEKLSREQFSQWPCGLTGIRLAGTAATAVTPVTGGTPVVGVDGYETRLVDPVRRSRRRGAAGYTSADVLLAGFIDQSAAGTGPLRSSGVAPHVGPTLGIAARPARYRVLDETALTVVDVDGTNRTESDSESEALAARDRSPDRANLVVAGAHEGAVP
jgi:hypothetical protein